MCDKKQERIAYIKAECKCLDRELSIKGAERRDLERELATLICPFGVGDTVINHKGVKAVVTDVYAGYSLDRYTGCVFARLRRMVRSMRIRTRHTVDMVGGYVMNNQKPTKEEIQRARDIVTQGGCGGMRCTANSVTVECPMLGGKYPEFDCEDYVDFFNANFSGAVIPAQAFLDKYDTDLGPRITLVEFEVQGNTVIGYRYERGEKFFVAICCEGNEVMFEFEDHDGMAMLVNVLRTWGE